MAEAKKTLNGEKMVQIKLPRDPDPRHPQEEFYSLNFHNYIIKRGEYVEVPESLAALIRESEDAEDAAVRYADEKSVKEPK